MTTWDKTLYIRHPITKMYQFYKSDGNEELLMASNNQLHKQSGESFVSVGNLTSSKVKFLTYKDRFVKDVVLVADYGQLKKYDGNSVSSVIPYDPSVEEQTNPGLNDLNILTNFRTFAVKKDRIYAAAHPTVKNRVSFCFIDPIIGSAVYDYFPASYFFDVATEDNDEIIELKVFRDTLIIFCRRSIWALHGDGPDLANFQLVKINVPKGCIAPGSIQEVGNNLFYLSDDHVYSLFSTDRNFISAEPVSVNIHRILKDMGISDKEKAAGVFHDNKYFLSFPSGLTLVYDTTLKSWTKYTNIKANDFLVLDEVLYFSTNEGFIYRFSDTKYSDDGSPIPFLLKTKIIDFDSPIHRKKVKRMWIAQKQWAGYHSSYDLFGTIDQYELIDFKQTQVLNGAGAVWDESEWDNSLWDFSEVSQDEIKLRKKAKSLQLQISNNKADEPISIFGLFFEYQRKKP
ncbi:hypothetical protein MKY20_11540 [Cytobacillus sp. FSL W8-0315]|uniref:hypothetical protein n=1 Tax=Cytobacillus sp. FSL W8-0315 TaxID=2921600 RepID=UPI0030FB4281